MAHFAQLSGSIVQQVIVVNNDVITSGSQEVEQLGIDFLKENNLTNWFARTAESLLPLYYLLQKDILATGYIQADACPETSGRQEYKS